VRVVASASACCNKPQEVRAEGRNFAKSVICQYVRMRFDERLFKSVQKVFQLSEIVTR
jgi:hypothetical protein